MGRTNHYNNDGKPLSRDQVIKLKILARDAFRKLDALGLVDVAGGSVSARFDAWCHAEQKKAVGIESLSKCQNGHFRRLRGHFLTLAGKEDQGYADYVKTGKVKDRGAPADTHEARELWRVKIRRALAEHERVVTKPANASDYQRGEVAMSKGGVITMAYAVSEAKRKFPAVPLADLTAAQLRVMYFHLDGRIRSREGRGKAEKRNMKQRRKGGEA